MEKVTILSKSLLRIPGENYQAKVNYYSNNDENNIFYQWVSSL